MFFFAGARIDRSSSGLVAFCHRSTSPAEHTILRILAALGDPGGDLWLPLIGSEGWDAATYHSATMIGIGFCANLAMRCINQFDQWPLRLGVLVNPDAPLDVKAQVAQDFADAEDCCAPAGDGLTNKLRMEIPPGETVQSPRFLRFFGGPCSKWLTAATS